MVSQNDDHNSTFPHNRRSLRLATHDYSSTARYFVTLRAKTNDPLFETPQLRAILTQEWLALPERFPSVTLDEFVIMPDHMHGILFFNGQVRNPPTLGRVIGAYKSPTTVAWIQYSKSVGINCIDPFWLRNYHERIIRNNDELEGIRQYIRNNPQKLENRQY